MRRLFLLCLLSAGLIQLPGCAIYGGSSGTTGEAEVETKGEQFSRCLDKTSPEKCDEQINGPAKPRDRTY